jgi:uncharacterized protein YjbI with pentapeptide repeats
MNFPSNTRSVLRAWAGRYHTRVLFLLIICFATPALSQVDSPRPEVVRRPAQSPACSPQEDPEKANLEKEKLSKEVEKLTLENENARHNFQNLFFENVSVIVAIFLGFFSLLKYLNGRRAELRRREEERFEQIVKGVGSGNLEERISSAVLLPTFLAKSYRRFFVQVFNLAAGNLRLKPDGDLAPLAQTLTSVLRESYPLARGTLKPEEGKPLSDLTGRHLNAASVRLDRNNLAGADLCDAWLMRATFHEATLVGADFTGAILEGADFSHAKLNQATLSKANLKDTNFTKAALESAELADSTADGAKFNGAILTNVTVTGGSMSGADFTHANLAGAEFTRVWFTPLAPNRAANPEAAETLVGAKFYDVEGLTPSQIAECSRKGAIFGTQPAKSTAL